MIAALLPLARTAAPLLVAAGIGWSAAWYVQGVRLQSARNDLQAERAAAALAVAESERKANALHDETARGWAAAVDSLRRARAAGWVPVLPAADPGPGLPAAGRADGAGTDAVPDAARLEACHADLARVTTDAQTTTLQLNRLQDAVERQAD